MTPERVKGNKHSSAYPHEGACIGCRQEKKCNVCGKPKDSGSCTNGRCSHCHFENCTPGGDVAPGHGFGKVS